MFNRTERKSKRLFEMNSLIPVLSMMWILNFNLENGMLQLRIYDDNRFVLHILSMIQRLTDNKIKSVSSLRVLIITSLTYIKMRWPEPVYSKRGITCFDFCSVSRNILRESKGLSMRKKWSLHDYGIFNITYFT